MAGFEYVMEEIDAQARHLVPEHLRPGLFKWIEFGCPVGGFLTSVLENDLGEAVVKADEDSMSSLWSLIIFLYNWSPPDCWGSSEKVKAWAEREGLKGNDQKG